ncbi:helix-turn-helix domain-containing protein [Chryseobacterium arthrosphaerae]|uniref:helix-turn-helix domain-containing protein n=1 Tax=Chryseobacterium arthrosphaerae TaxID=651561 RepID=UPI002414D05D|nr:helix-turn-helix transcriptional regulator [Chryseobacterium arthrosphaerae]MDG4655033.1 helix-turn-helix transcriptional regulator [Chryseobacterium arthrosphaerae]
MKDILYPLVGQRIQDIRKENNVSQQELAEFLDLSRTSISNIENGRHPIFLHHIYTIAEKFDIPIDRILPSVFEIQNEQKLKDEDWRKLLLQEGLQDEKTIKSLLDIIKKDKS